MGNIIIPFIVYIYTHHSLYIYNSKQSMFQFSPHQQPQASASSLGYHTEPSAGSEGSVCLWLQMSSDSSVCLLDYPTGYPLAVSHSYGK